MNLTKSVILAGLFGLALLTLSCGPHPGGFSVKVDAEGWTKVSDEVITETKADTTSGAGESGPSFGNVDRWRRLNVEYRGPNLNELLDSETVIPRPRLTIKGREYEEPEQELQNLGIDVDQVSSSEYFLAELSMTDLDEESRRQSLELETVEERSYGGNPGYYFEYTSTRNSVPFRQWGIVTVSDEFLLKVLFSVPQQYYEERTQELDSIINSFEVK